MNTKCPSDITKGFADISHYPLIPFFVRYLKEKKCYHNYLHNWCLAKGGVRYMEKIEDVGSYFKIFLVSLINRDCDEEFINHAFTWANTHEGDTYWRILSNEWRVKCHSIKK